LTLLVVTVRLTVQRDPPPIRLARGPPIVA